MKRSKKSSPYWKKKIQQFFSSKQRRVATFLAVFVLVLMTFGMWVYAAATAIDTSISTNTAIHNHAAPSVVVTSDTTAYAFYVDSGGQCVYSKSTNVNNATPIWSAAVQIDSQTDCTNVAVWYDRWTPGDTTGNYIYIITEDSGSDDIWFNRLDTSTDTRLNTAAPNSLSSAPGVALTNTLTNSGTYPVIVKSADGTIYAGVTDTPGFILKCSTTCQTSSNWSNINMPTTMEGGAAVSLNDNDSMNLMPLLDGDILAIYHADSPDDILSAVYDSSTGTWLTAWNTVDGSAQGNTTYDGGMGATIDKSTGDVYIAYVTNTGTLGAGNDGIETAKFSESTRTWAAKTALFTTESRGLTNAKIAFDEDGSDFYVAYSIRATSATATTTSIYYRTSTDDMTTWSAESAAVNAVADDFYGLSMNIMSNQRIFATWYDITNDDLTGNTIADIIPITATYEQSSYRVFQNNNSTDVGTAIASANATATLTQKGQAFRVRMLLHVGNSNLPSGGANFKLQYATKGAGTCTSPTGSYTDITTSTEISFYDNSTPTDATVLTANVNDPTHSSDTIVNQTYEEGNTFSNSQGAINVGQDGKWDFALYDNGATGGGTYCLRIIRSTGVALDTYTQYPQIVIASSPVFTQSNYRMYSNANSTDVGTPLAAQNTGITLNNLSEQFRLRMLITFGTNGVAVSGQPFKLQVAAKGAGSCASPTGSYEDISSTTPIIYHNNASPADNAGLTTNANDPTSSNTIQRQSYNESSPFNNNQSALSAGEDGMWDFSLKDGNSVTGETYCIRAVTSTGTTLNTYSQYPEITTLGVAIDKSPSATNTNHQNTGSNVVFVSDQVGYIFYINSDGRGVYKKTTDGGINWGTETVYDSQTDLIHTAVWFDKWTPGDMGSSIHIVTMDATAFFYTRLNTPSDTLTTTVNANASITNSYTSLEYHASITKGTGGTLYAGTVGAITRCNRTCTTSGNWSSTSTPWAFSHDTVVMAPLANNDLMGILWEKGANALETRTYTASTNTWSAATVLDATSSNDNTPYEVGLAVIANKSNNDLYMTVLDDANTLGGNDDVRTFKYSGGAWTQMTSVLADNARGIMDTSIGYDENSGDVYVIYSVQTTPGNETTGQIYWKKSTDGMTTWGAEQGPVNTSAADIWGPNINYVSDERLFVNWFDNTGGSLLGASIADLGPATPVTTPQFIQSELFNSTGLVSSVNVTFDSDVESGNLIVVAVSLWNSLNDAVVQSVTDNKGNTYHLAEEDPTGQTGATEPLAIYYAYNVTGGNNLQVTVTGLNSAFMTAAIHEYTNISTTDPKDKTSNANAIGAASTNGDSGTTATTAVADELVFGAFNHTDGDTTATAGTDFTMRQENNDNTTSETLYTEDKTVSATGTYNATMTFGATVQWRGAVVTFKGLSGVETPTNDKLMRHGGFFNSAGVKQPFTF